MCSAPPPGPAWPPAGALAAFDFAGGRYWTSNLGNTDPTQTLDTYNNFAPFDPALDIVPGVGLTTGGVNRGYDYLGPVIDDQVGALFADTGFTAIIDCAYDQDASENGQAFFMLTWAHLDNSGDGAPAVMMIGGGSPGEFFGGYTQDAGFGRQASAFFPTPPANFTKAGYTTNADGSSLSFSYDGNAAITGTGEGQTGPFQLGVKVITYQSGGVNPATSTISRLVIYPPQSDAALAALTA